MPGPAIDYAAMAKQAGAFKSEPPPPIDYAALAKTANETTDAESPDGPGTRFVKGVGDTLLPSTTANDYNFFDTKGGAGYAVAHKADKTR